MQGWSWRRAVHRRLQRGGLVGGLLLLVASHFVAGGAAAQTVWQQKLFETVIGVQFDAACLSTPGIVRHVHILGVQTEATSLSDDQRSFVIGKINETLGKLPQARLTSASAFQSIAHSTSISTDNVERLQELLRSGDVADVTVVIRPIALEGANGNFELLVWTTDKAREGRITCSKQLALTVPFEQASDPACGRGFERADQSDSQADWEAFLRFFEHCPQAPRARQRLARVRERACSETWGRVAAVNKASEFERFARENAHCNEARAAEILANALRSQEQEAAEREAADKTAREAAARELAERSALEAEARRLEDEARRIAAMRAEAEAAARDAAARLAAEQAARDQSSSGGSGGSGGGGSGGGGSTASSVIGCGWFAIFTCHAGPGEAAGSQRRLGGIVVNTNEHPNFRNGWYCVAEGPFRNKSSAQARVNAKRGAAPTAYVKKNC